MAASYDGDPETEAHFIFCMYISELLESKCKNVCMHALMKECTCTFMQKNLHMLRYVIF